MTVNIHQVVANLKTTIAAKEAYLEEIRQARTLAAREEDHALYATQEFLKINIQELKVILYDVEQCAEQFSLMSWQINPERMGQ